MKKLFSLLAVLALSVAAFAAPHHPSKWNLAPKANVELSKRAFPAHGLQTVAPDVVRPMHAPAAVQGALTASYVEAAYYGTATGEPTDWVFFFVTPANGICIYADVYDVADETHIDGTYSISNGSLGEAFVVPTPGDTVEVVGGSIQVQHNTSTNYRFDANLQGADGVTYTLTQDLDVDAYDYYIWYMQDYYGYDGTIYLEDAGTNPGPDPDEVDYTGEPEVATTVNATMNAVTFITDYFAEYGDVDIYLFDINAAGDTVAALPLYVYCSTIDPDTYVPAGTYTINETLQTGSVEASSGYVYYNGTYYVTPAYYATINGGGIQEIYYLVSGTMTLVKNADKTFSITVNATSAKGSTVNATYTSSKAPSAVENVDALKTVKSVRDGQMIIRRGADDYDVLGRIVK